MSSIKSDSGAAVSGEDLHRDYKQTANVQLKPELLQKLKAFFDKMDTNNDGDVSKDEAVAFWAQFCQSQRQIHVQRGRRGGNGPSVG